MMTKLIAAVEQLVNEEYDRASKDHGERFHSLHEAFGVLMEEFEETRDELETVSRFLNGFWKEVKRDSCDIVFLNEAKKSAINLACEAIQVAAMAHKARQGVKNDDE